MILSATGCGKELQTTDISQNSENINYDDNSKDNTNDTSSITVDENTTIGARYYSWINYIPTTDNIEILDVKQYDDFDEVLVNWKSIAEMEEYVQSMDNYDYIIETLEDNRIENGYAQDSIEYSCTSKKTNRTVYIGYSSEDVCNGHITLYSH